MHVAVTSVCVCFVELAMDVLWRKGSAFKALFP